ncbi:alpha/beta hydrolase [Hahella sp. CCB-MM4]|uniref:alpha/beta fold hydrolase n=1 Tax=Hahella sp. (strain CCB-MM4) TaxID=1926491 RepID=UPI000B9AF3F2|nr:alpha/beta hydrolase [Hahella sp. CCB-MM4]OZG71735.1 alpha/beta hydrolase [Hahella sp. CCB-MM4]
MPTINVNGVSLYYEDQGTGPETIVFAHGLLWSGRMYDDQVEALKDRYRCITFDFRGQGQSEVTASGYDMDTLANDTAEMIKTLNCAPCHFVGLSMGGFIGQRLAINYPTLIKSLVLLETSADPEPEENIPRYRKLNFIARWFGFGIVAERVMPIMFGQKFLTDPTRTQQRALWKQRMIANRRLGTTRAVKGVIDRKGMYDQLDSINVPTLIIVGDQDVATIPAKSERMRDRINGSRMVVIPGAGHTSTVEEPVAVNKTLEEFLRSLSGG